MKEDNMNGHHDGLERTIQYKENFSKRSYKVSVKVTRTESVSCDNCRV